MLEGRDFFDGDFFLFHSVKCRHYHSVSTFADVVEVRVSRRHVKQLTADCLDRPLRRSDLQKRNVQVRDLEVIFDKGDKANLRHYLPIGAAWLFRHSLSGCVPW